MSSQHGEQLTVVIDQIQRCVSVFVLERRKGRAGKMGVIRVSRVD
jgi:hypothetical protein